MQATTSFHKQHKLLLLRSDRLAFLDRVENFFSSQMDILCQLVASAWWEEMKLEVARWWSLRLMGSNDIWSNGNWPCWRKWEATTIWRNEIVGDGKQQSWRVMGSNAIQGDGNRPHWRQQEATNKVMKLWHCRWWEATKLEVGRQQSHRGTGMQPPWRWLEVMTSKSKATESRSQHEVMM